MQSLNRVLKTLKRQSFVGLASQRPARTFFFKSKKQPEEQQKKEEQAKQEEKQKEATEENNEEKTEDQETTKDEVDSDEEFTVKVKDIKKLINDQDKEIEDLKFELNEAVVSYRKQVDINDKNVNELKEEVKKISDENFKHFFSLQVNIKKDIEKIVNKCDSNIDLTKMNIDEIKAEYKSIVENIKITTDKFDNTLQEFKIVQFNPIGEKFDPNLHEALTMIKDPTKEPNTVCSVVKTGWKIGDRIIRAAKVICVSK